MTLAILPSEVSLIQSGLAKFGASGGTEPYTFSVETGFGSIDPSSGDFSAPSQPGTTVVRVTDSLGATSEATVYTDTALTLLCEIIQNGMGLTEDQVYLYNQKVMIPTDDRLYIAVGVITVKPFGNTRNIVPTSGGMSEVLSTNVRATLSIDLMGRSMEALDRKEELVLALNSTYSQKIQEANGFQIAPIPSSFANISGIDGAAIPYRFSLAVSLQYQITKASPVEYYDTFADPQTLVEP
jgi:hypothetical protein